MDMETRMDLQKSKYSSCNNKTKTLQMFYKTIIYCLLGISFVQCKTLTPEQEEARAVEADNEIHFTEANPDALTAFLSSGTRFVFYGAKWCGHCKKASPKWRSLEKSIAKSKTVMPNYDFKMVGFI